MLRFAHRLHIRESTLRSSIRILRRAHHLRCDVATRDSAESPETTTSHIAGRMMLFRACRGTLVDVCCSLGSPLLHGGSHANQPSPTRSPVISTSRRGFEAVAVTADEDGDRPAALAGLVTAAFGRLGREPYEDLALGNEKMRPGNAEGPSHMPSTPASPCNSGERWRRLPSL